MKNRINHMTYLPNMEVLDSNIQQNVINLMNKFDYTKYTKDDVIRVLNKDNIGIEDFAILLSPPASDYIEKIAQKSLLETKKHFGNSITLFTPLYISNYCDNYCAYCGYNCHNNIKRAKLNFKEIEIELKAIAKTGLEEILILTGESRSMSSLEYIGEACKLAKKYFKLVSIEIYPLSSDEYNYIHQCGADFVSVYQETYNSDTYEKYHISGNKRIYPYRFDSQERALIGGMRGVGFGALLGLDDFRKDAFATGLHAYLLQKKYPHAEISFSCPRLCPIKNNDKINPKDVHELQLLQVMMAYRLFMPFSTIVISSRECARFRDNVLGLVANKSSAGSNTAIGEHDEELDNSGDEQFEITDPRSVDEIIQSIRDKGLQPVMNDYVYL